MGAAVSSSSSYTRVAAQTDIFASEREKAAFEKIVGDIPVLREDPAYHVVFSSPKPFTQLTQQQVEYLNQEYGATLAQNNLRSGNFRVLLRFLIHALPFCCRVEKMLPDEIELHAPSHGPANSADGRKQTAESWILQAVNALFLMRNFTMRFIEKQDECALLAHFNRPVHEADWNVITSPRNRKDNTAIRVGEPSGVHQSEPITRPDDLAFRFLDTLMTVLIDFPPTPKTYDLHVEVINTLLVLLSPVAFPRDHSKEAGDMSAHNPFLHMIMIAAASGTNKSFWAAGAIHRLLQNYIDQIPSPLTSKNSESVAIALQNAKEMSIIQISEATNLAEEMENFSYLTLDGIGSIAYSIFRFPWSFYQYFLVNNEHVSPLTDRSVFLLLVLLQSCRDGDSVNNPYREALCCMTNSEADENLGDTRKAKHDDSSSKTKLTEIPFSKLFASIGRNAPYESSHLLLYTLMYTNAMMHEATISNCEVNQLMLPLLETLYHARSVEPSRIYMLVIVLLTYTQDPAFVRDAHTKVMVHNVPWYSEKYILDVSLGSLMMVIFTRLIYRNITHFQDSFIHLNAFAGLSNLARHAENIHVYAAQNIVSLIEMLAKKEAQLAAKMEEMVKRGTLDNTELEMLTQKQKAYVEFIRLLLGIVSSCLKAKLLPRNPQLIYSLLYRADTFTALQRHPDFTYHVNNGPVWNTLSRFQSLVESKTSPEEVLDVDTVFNIIRSECVSLLASSASLKSRHVGENGTASLGDDEEPSYLYEEETDPEQFFVPYIWKLIYEQTPDFCWKVDKITLFMPNKTVVTE